MRNLQNDRKTWARSGNARSMDVRGFQISQAGAEEGAGSGTSFLSRSERALSHEVALCRPKIAPAGAVRDTGTLKAVLDWGCRIYPLNRLKKISGLSYLFCYTQKCSSGLSATPVSKKRNGKRRCVLSFLGWEAQTLPLFNTDEERSEDRKVKPGVESLNPYCSGLR
jgi:hypothetical protein